jgi:hypothetical protein
MANILSRITYFKSFHKIKSYQKKKILCCLNVCLSFVTKKTNELLLSLYLLQSRNVETVNSLIIQNKIKKKNYKFIVIGSGPAGSVTALNLQKEFGDVLLIEKGSYCNVPKTKHPGDEFIKKWEKAGVSTSVYPIQINFSSGKCLGGGSEINSGLYHYPKKKFFDKWRLKNKITDIDYRYISVINKELLKQIPVNKSIGKNVNNSSKEFLKGSKINNLKYENITRLNKKKFKTFEKSSMTRTLLKNFSDLSGDILANSDVQKIHFTKNKLWEIKTNSKTNNHFTCKYLFLCLGSINTQKLLLNSNFKNKKFFNKFKLHPMIKVIPKFKRNVQNANNDIHPYQITQFYPNFILGAASSGKQFLEMSILDNAKFLNDVRKNWKKMSIYHSTFSFGVGKIIKLPFLNKYIYTYKIKNIELNKIKFSLTKLCKVLFDGGAEYIYLINREKTKVYPFDFKKIINNINDIKDVKLSSVHILGKIEMGEKDYCYTNSFGKIKKYDNIFINDSSLISTSLLQNPQGTIMVLAYRNILKFIEVLKGKE